MNACASEELLQALSQAKHPAGTGRVLQQHASLVNEHLLRALTQEVENHEHTGNPERAGHLAAISLQAAEQWGAPEYIAAAHVLRGDVAREGGDLNLALEAYREAVVRYRALGDPESSSCCCSPLPYSCPPSRPHQPIASHRNRLP